MKTSIFTFLLLLSCCHWLAAQPCLPDGITFSTQGQIDSFQIYYLGCTEIAGDMLIRGNDITNLNGLTGIEVIGGDLTIGGGSILGALSNDNLATLNGLDSLSFIGGDLWITGNINLADLNGLNSLDSIGGSIKIGRHQFGIGGIGGYGLKTHGNPKLTSISALGALDFVGNEVEITGNHSLNNLTGLESINSVNGNFTIAGNKSLDNLGGLDNLFSIEGDLMIFANDSLTSLSGLDKVAAIEGSLFIGFLFEYEDYDISVTYCLGNNLLTDVTSLQKLNTIGGTLEIACNKTLTELTGLENLTSVADDFKIRYSDQLISLCGLNKDLYIGGGFWAANNQSLEACHVEGICDHLSNPPDTVVIENNAPGCNSQTEVETACSAPITDCNTTAVSSIPGGNSQLIAFPNPATDFLNLHFPKPFYETLQVSLFDMQGRLVSQQPFIDGQAIEVDHLPNGMYLLKVVAGEQVFTGKFIKQ